MARLVTVEGLGQALQHERLHDELDHEAYHDRLEHRQFHRRYDYYYAPYQGYYYPQNSGYNPTGTLCALAYWSAAAIRNQYLKKPGPLVDA